MASAQVGLFQAQPNQHRARHVRRTRGGAPECGLPSPRPEPRQKRSSQSTLNAEASPEEAQRFRSSFLHRPQSSQPVPVHKLELLARGGALAPAAALRAATQAPDKPGGGRGRRLVNLEEPRFFAPEWNKSKNTGITSVDRSTKATLGTYNPWIQLSRLQKIYHFQHKKLRFTKLTLPLKLVHTQKGRDLMLVL